MISEVENILNGEVVRKVNADKAIGVSSANLSPDEKGEVPLSKQSAFTIETTQTQTAPAMEAPVAPAEPEITEELDLTPSTSAEPVAPVAAPVEATPAMDTPVPEVPVAPTEPVAEPTAPVTEAPAEPAMPTDILTDAPVDVVPPTELEGVDFNSIIPNIPLVDERPQEETQEAPAEAPVELPEMPDQILAEAPTTVDNNLFVDTPAEPVVETPVVPETPTPEVPAAPAAPATEEETLFPEMPELPEAPVETELPVEETPEDTPEAQVETTEEAIEGLPGVDFTDAPILPEVGTLEETPEAPSEGEEPQPVNGMMEYKINDERLDEILDRLNNISDSLDVIREKIEERSEVFNNTQTLPAMEAPVLETPTLEAPAMEAPVLDTPAAPAGPSLEAPVFDQPAPAPTEKQEELVDALSQIPGYDVSSVDDTPIQGGMFI